MKLFSKIKKTVSQAPKKLLVFLALAILSVLTFGVVKAEFYPDRPVYDYNRMPLNGKDCQPADDAAGNRCGSMNGPVFNSFVNAPGTGDERAFADARKTDGTTTYQNVVTDVTNGSKEVIVRMYVHNNANTGTNASGKGIAKDTKVRVLVPTGETQSLRTRSYISASNAGTVEDTVDYTSDTQAFRLEYIPGSAKIFSNGPVNGATLSDSIVTTGAPIGYNALNGDLPGCFEYEATVEVRLRVLVRENPTLKFTKQVRMAGTKEWKKEVAAKPGDKVEWLLTTVSGGTGVSKGITVRDVAAPNTQLVSGSVKWIDVNQNATQNDTSLFSGPGGGINFGNYDVNGGFYVMYASTVKGDFSECEVRVRNLAYVRSERQGEIGDDADVIIKKDNCNPPTPKNPGVSIDKKVDGVERKTVNVNQEFTYQLVVKNTGDVDLKNVKVSDNAPANVQFLSTDKGSVAGNKLTYTIPAFAIGASESINIKAKVIAEVAGDIVNTACVNAPEVNPNNPNDEDDCDDATVNVPTPEYRCDLLTTSKIGDNKYRFTTTYTARNGATFKNVKYTYGDGTGVTTGSATAEHTYAKDGTYKINATVTFTVNGVEKTATAPACNTEIEIAPKVTPKYDCDLLTVEKIADRQYRYTVKFTANNGANYKFATIDFGDGSAKFMTNGTTATHTYSKDGTFVTRAVITFTVDGENKTVDSDKCAAPVTLTSTPVTPPTTPTVLPNTGAGNIFGIFAATSLVGAMLHKLYFARKEA